MLNKLPRREDVTPPPAQDSRFSSFPNGSMTAEGTRRQVFMLDPIADEELASVWAKRGTNWRKDAVIKRVLQ
jgi:hypothetical protein